MQWYEVSAALKYSYYAYRQQWEQARVISYVTAQVQSTKKLKYEDIIKLPWDDDKEIVDEDNTKITKADIERINKMAQTYLNRK